MRRLLIIRILPGKIFTDEAVAGLPKLAARTMACNGAESAVIPPYGNRPCLAADVRCSARLDYE
jgi:hypothetical protein